MPAKKKTEASPLQGAFSVLEDKFPQYKSQLRMAGNVAEQFTKTMDTVEPYVEQATAYVGVAREKAKQLKLDDFVPMLVGLSICFFGGYFTMLIAVFETVRLLCWDELKASFGVLKRNYEVAREQSRKDDKVDADGNGIPDVQEMAMEKLFSRKVALFVKSVNMEEVRTAGRTLITAVFSVVASLRIKMAQSLTMAGSFINTVKEQVPLERIINDALPPEQQKWSGFIADSIFGFMTMLLATTLRGAIGPVQCASRGASVFVRNAIKLAKEKGLMEDNITMESQKARAMVTMVAVLGFSWQMSNRGSIPFPLNVFLFPLSLLESTLSFLVGMLSSVTPAAVAA